MQCVFGVEYVGRPSRERTHNISENGSLSHAALGAAAGGEAETGQITTMRSPTLHASSSGMLDVKGAPVPTGSIRAHPQVSIPHRGVQTFQG